MYEGIATHGIFSDKPDRNLCTDRGKPGWVWCSVIYYQHIVLHQHVCTSRCTRQDRLTCHMCVHHARIQGRGSLRATSTVTPNSNVPIKDRWNAHIKLNLSTHKLKNLNSKHMLACACRGLQEHRASRSGIVKLLLHWCNQSCMHVMA